MKYILSIYILLTMPVLTLHAQSKQEKAVAAAIETFNNAILNGDRSALENSTASSLSYGHSSGKVEPKAEFVDLLVKGFYDYSSIITSDQKITIDGKSAVVRSTFTAKLTIDGAPYDLKLPVLQVWQKQHGSWKLLARQAIRM